jgi:uncharacterized protein (TIGR02996 family)
VSSTLDALLRTILDNPDDDLPRLVYADCLDEQPGEVACGACGGSRLFVRVGHQGGPHSPFAPCTACHGSGRVPDPGRPAERAEFIRVQCELAAIQARYQSDESPELPCITDHPADDSREIVLRGRERNLTSRHGREWIVAAGLPDGFVEWDTGASGNGAFSITYRFRRGFVESVSCTLEAFAGGPCRRCDGDGQRHGSDRTYPPTPCPVCRGTGRTPGIAPALFACQPVTAVTLTDRVPLQLRRGWVWRSGSDNDPVPNGLPDFLHQYGLWDGSRPAGERPTAFATRDLALSALSRACVAWGRRAAGLPPLNSQRLGVAGDFRQ